MQTYSIQLLIDSDDLRTLQAARRTIVLARTVNDAQLPNVIWQSFKPCTENVVTWTDTYGIYAAKTPLVHGAQIVPARSLPYPACDASAYTFAPDATFHGPYYAGGMLGPNQFCVTNDVPPTHHSSLLFGLAQEAIINGNHSEVRPLSAQIVPAYHRMLFSAVNRVYMWLQSGVTSGMVHHVIPHNVTSVDFGRYTHVQTLKYDPAHDTFVPYSYVKQGFIHKVPNVSWSHSVR